MIYRSLCLDISIIPTHIFISKSIYLGTNIILIDIKYWDYILTNYTVYKIDIIDYKLLIFVTYTIGATHVTKVIYIKTNN